MRRLLLFTLLLGCSTCRGASPRSYLFLWAGDANEKASDFLAVIDANPSSSHYGSVLTSIPTGVSGSHPHHTEQEMPADGHLLANGFAAGRTWLFDLTKPLRPAILTSFGDVAQFSHPHTYVRLANNHVLATFQYAVEPATTTTPPVANTTAVASTAKPQPSTASTVTSSVTFRTGKSGGMSMPMHSPASTDSVSHFVQHHTGGLVEMDERGNRVRSASATDASVGNTRIYPYSVLPLPSFDRAVSTTTDMDDKNKPATAEWVQLWRLSDLTLLKTIALPPGPRGNENQFTGEPRLLPDGQGVYIHTFNCGLYLMRGVERAEPTTKLVKTFEGMGCGVPLLVSHYWLQPVPDAHALLSLDITDPDNPREVSRVKLGDDEQPHWIAADTKGRRIVLNSAGGGTGNRLYIINFDRLTGKLSMDEHFRDADSKRAGIRLTGRTWPHGFSGTAHPHGTVFSR